VQMLKVDSQLRCAMRVGKSEARVRHLIRHNICSTSRLKSDTFTLRLKGDFRCDAHDIMIQKYSIRVITLYRTAFVRPPSTMQAYTFFS
jgi:hypothetical protein